MPDEKQETGAMSSNSSQAVFICMCNESLAANFALYQRPFAFPCASMAFCQRGSPQHGGHYPSGIGTSAETGRRYFKIPPHRYYILGCRVKERQSALSHRHITFFWEFNTSVRLHLLNRKMTGCEVSAESSAPLSSRERFQLVWGGVCRGFKERRWASVEHERQQFIILIAETWSENSVEAGDGDVKPEPSASRKTLCFDLFFLINTGD